MGLLYLATYLYLVYHLLHHIKIILTVKVVHSNFTIWKWKRPKSQIVFWAETVRISSWDRFDDGLQTDTEGEPSDAEVVFRRSAAVHHSTVDKGSHSANGGDGSEETPLLSCTPHSYLWSLNIWAIIITNARFAIYNALSLIHNYKFWHKLTGWLLNKYL